MNEANLQECDLCHDVFGLNALMLCGGGQMLCHDCRRERDDAAEYFSGLIKIGQERQGIGYAK